MSRQRWTADAQELQRIVSGSRTQLRGLRRAVRYGWSVVLVDNVLYLNGKRTTLNALSMVQERQTT